MRDTLIEVTLRTINLQLGMAELNEVYSASYSSAVCVFFQEHEYIVVCGVLVSAGIAYLAQIDFLYLIIASVITQSIWVLKAEFLTLTSSQLMIKEEINQIYVLLKKIDNEFSLDTITPLMDPDTDPTNLISTIERLQYLKAIQDELNNQVSLITQKVMELNVNGDMADMAWYLSNFMN